MLAFILGFLLGGIVSFLAVAICSINKTDEECLQPKPTSVSKENGDSDAGK
jgi:hypothetical protein